MTTPTKKKEKKSGSRAKKIQREENSGFDYNLFSPTDYRYFNADLAPFLSEEAFVHYKAKVEAALAGQLAKEGLCSNEVAREIADACKQVTATEVYGEEERIKHDVRALANVIRRRVSDRAKPYVHLAATSYDIVDTANAMRYRDALQQVVLPDLLKLERAFIEISKAHANTVQVGRTHGQHAEPITFGFYLSYYVSRLGGRILAIKAAAQKLAGKFSGAVGVYGPLSLLVEEPRRFEQELLASVGLEPSEVSTQIVQAEPMTDLFHCIVSTFGVLANFARDMRHLQRSEIGEVAEEFSSNQQVGSSTMPQKRNPISFENVESLWKKFMPQMVTVYLDQVSEHQRDLTNSSSQRYLPELIVAFDYAARRLYKTVWNREANTPKLKVDSTNLRRNFARSEDAMSAEPLYILLAASGGHPDAHEQVREVVQGAIDSGVSFQEALRKNNKLNKYYESIPEEKRAYVEDPSKYTGIAAKRTLQVAREWEDRLQLKSAR